MAEESPHLVLDGKGIFYMTLCGTWTVLVATGMGFLWSRRSMPLLKIRGLGLTFTAIGFVHVYWIIVQFGSVMSPFPAQVEYWVMGIWYPCGIALFHASNSRFLHVAKQQRRFVQEDARRPLARYGKLGQFVSWRRMGHDQRIVALVGAGMLVQILLVIIMYLLSRKFHPSFGIPGTEVVGSPWDVNHKQGTGWEWWPSLVWQFLWAWVVAPIVLWRARRVHDTLGWRTQTVLCCLASLPATPMWLIALYVPAMQEVNQYWIPPQWIAVSIMWLETCSIFLPCWQTYKHQLLRQETLNLISAWEEKQDLRNRKSLPGNAATSQQVSTESFTLDKGSSYGGSTVTALSNESLYCMSALERFLQSNPEPLRRFSALNDFSGENIAFLTSVADWKRRSDLSDDEGIRDAFSRALGIYHDFVSPATAEFPVNLASKELAGLWAMFDKASGAVYGTKELAHPNTPVTPFMNFDSPYEVNGLRPKKGPAFEGQTLSLQGSTCELMEGLPPSRNLYSGQIPVDFSITVFDQAQHSIKYLVLTNTWPKFLQSKSSAELSLSQPSQDRDRSTWKDHIKKILSLNA